MTDRDGRSNGSKTFPKRVFTPDYSLGQQPLLSTLTTVILNETNPPTIANTDSEGDYETSSEGPHSPGQDFQQSTTTFAGSFDGNISNESPSVFPEEDLTKQTDPSASYTVIGAAESPRTDVTSKISDCVDQIESASSYSEIQVPLSGLEGFEARRTEYFVAPRIGSDANKSESLPVITIATPWGCYEYPDVHMPAERLVSDSQVDIKEKMRLIAACMDGSDLASSRSKFPDKSEQFLCPDAGKHETKPGDGGFSEVELKVESSRVTSRPTTPRTRKMITVTSPKIFSEAFNVLPIIRNPDLGSDYTFPPSPSGSSLPVALNNHAVSMGSSFYLHKDGAESPRNSNSKKSSYDPLSRIEGELAPLQNELSEIRGKVRALNLDFNLSCIDGVSKFSKAMNWTTERNQSSHSQITPVKDDFVLSDYQTLNRSQNTSFKSTNTIGFSNFMGNNQARYQYPFANRSSVASACSWGLEEVENEFETAELIADKTTSHRDASPAQTFSSKNFKPEVEGISTGSATGTDRNLLPVLHVCTSIPSIQSYKEDVGSADSEDETESCKHKAKTSPEIRLPDFSDRISIVPIAYIGGMPDPPAEPVFNFAQEKNRGFEIGHKVLRIEHPDAPPRRREENAETVSSLSDTILTLDYSETEDSLSLRKEEDDSSVENSLRPSDRIPVSKLAKKSSYGHFSTSTDGKETHGKTCYIRGLISGPEDFL